mgnify:CR=1 FL=1
MMVDAHTVRHVFIVGQSQLNISAMANDKTCLTLVNHSAQSHNK